LYVIYLNIIRNSCPPSLFGPPIETSNRQPKGNAMNVVMIGAGYVGLTTGVCFASMGYNVCCVDIDEDRIRELEAGSIPIYEPGLDELIAESRAKRQLRFSSDIGSAVADADFVFIAVGTPSKADGDINLSYVEEAARGIARHLRDTATVVVKSTVVAGTAKAVADIIAAERRGRRISVASNPEFLREGSAIEDFMNADRIVVGADDTRAGNALETLYRPLIDRGIPFIGTSTINAELIKYAANAFLALKIGFINDVANLCENAGADVTAVAKGVGLDRRIGEAFLQPGPGFGGSCFPKDTRAFAATGRRYQASQALIERLIERNAERKVALADRILAALDCRGRDLKVAVLGLAFKANTDDIRESAALAIVPALQSHGITVAAHDPKAQAPARRVLGEEVLWHDDIYAAVKGADAVVVLTEWDEYRGIDLARIARLMGGKHLFDFRNLFLPEVAAGQGLVHHSLGRPKSEPAAAKSLAQASGASAWADVAASPFDAISAFGRIQRCIWFDPEQTEPARIVARVLFSPNRRIPRRLDARQFLSRSCAIL
jgi:UDPglucose 6-dehydrogenase